MIRSAVRYMWCCRCRLERSYVIRSPLSLQKLSCDTVCVAVCRSLSIVAGKAVRKIEIEFSTRRQISADHVQGAESCTVCH